MKNRKVILCILDGWGHGKIPEVSALARANTPYVDELYKRYPNAELVTFGGQVGLPDGQMGNSEVGHLNIGAGRVVYQELARINKAVREDELESNHEFKRLIDYAISNNKPVHLLGLLSDGGVHSHIDHIIELANKLSSKNINCYLHMFLDGRDTSPTAGLTYLTELTSQLNDKAQVVSVIGRYYAMDRDKRWERIKKAYDLLTKGIGEQTNALIDAVKGYYDKQVTDEFMEPIKLGGKEFGTIQDGDAVLFTNFRTDRPRQLTKVLTQENFPKYDMSTKELYYVTMTEYDEHYKNVHVLFTKAKIKNTLGEVISNNGLRQLRIAETEKYPHVTFFFSGGREEAFEGEKRCLVNSPKVATYDLQPEMSAGEITTRLTRIIKEDSPDLIILNYANADMVGHTGVFDAAVKAAETLDSCLSQLIPEALKHNYISIIIADHGNSDIMINKDGSPHTAHTTNPVPIIVLDPENKVTQVKSGKLADIAPTILYLMGIEIPDEMTGEILVNH